MSADDPLAQLIAAPLRPLPERWTVPDRVAQLEQARAFGSADAYWEWVARHQRWSQPWTRVRSGAAMSCVSGSSAVVPDIGVLLGR